MSTADGRAALATFNREKSNLVILDLMLPEGDRLLGLGLGADDYITKPFSPREVVVRVQAVLQRAGGEAPAEVLTVGNLEIDQGRMEVRRGGMVVALTPTEFGLLAALRRAPTDLAALVADVAAAQGSGSQS